MIFIAGDRWSPIEGKEGYFFENASGMVAVQSGDGRLCQEAFLEELKSSGEQMDFGEVGSDRRRLCEDLFMLGWARGKFGR